MNSETCCIVVEVPAPKVKKVALVKYRGIELGFKIGRGYSLGELKEVGLNYKLARQLNIPVDSRRKSVHKENVESLKLFLDQIKEIVNARKTKPARIAVVAQAKE
ncbi:ribosomal protein L13e [Ignisphaera sp. 4213-co]|uniref:Large ribosomal subunit protein eL13 n=1 Tax=Ignisphaera cupida TaxID=3050454 RepID=A0ABD4Z3R4_9CREN|nr:ribosomal protein L13e [Ignisphaera sp. 4213-co]MDK6027785.1 ribosomal protein L13e [Ignisphaera sp. 4213-co]